MKFTEAQLDQMLEEAAGYEVDLCLDPTLPHLGAKYLQGVISKCRNYTNRVIFYLQSVLREEKELKREIKKSELDLEFKMSLKLSDDPVVRAQPSIEDRKAVANSLLAVENEALAQLRIDIISVQETAKILRMKYNDLQRTSGDIKLQRSIVKDDKDDRLLGGGGYDAPQSKQDGSTHDNLPPHVRSIDPKDILDQDKRPVDMPEPENPEDADMIASFLSRHPEKDNQFFQSIGKRCIICKKPQFNTQSGISCELGHGGAPSIEDENEDEPVAQNSKSSYENIEDPSAIDYSSLLD